MRLFGTDVGVISISILLLALYFTPTIIAWLYRRQRIAGILALNLLTGWTVLGWIAALKWSTIHDRRALEDVAPLPRYQAEKRIIAALAIVVAVLILEAIRVYLFQPKTSAVVSAPAPSIIDPSTVTITSYSLRKSAQNLRGDFTIRNNNGYRVKDVEVKCVHATLDGTVLDSTYKTIHRTFEPYYEQRADDVDLGAIPNRTANSTCSAIGFSLLN
jgi:Superinfection immunity protein